jgi:hypothetical protein
VLHGKVEVVPHRACKVTVSGAVLSSPTGSAFVYPRILI